MEPWLCAPLGDVPKPIQDPIYPQIPLKNLFTRGKADVSLIISTEGVAAHA